MLRQQGEAYCTTSSCMIGANEASDAKRSSHGKEHPFVALENAKTYFSVDEREQDIITKHMFPKTLALPRYPESVVVSISDKLSAIYEYLARP